MNIRSFVAVYWQDDNWPLSSHGRLVSVPTGRLVSVPTTQVSKSQGCTYHFYWESVRTHAPDSKSHLQVISPWFLCRGCPGSDSWLRNWFQDLEPQWSFKDDKQILCLNMCSRWRSHWAAWDAGSNEGTLWHCLSTLGVIDLASSKQCHRSGGRLFQCAGDPHGYGFIPNLGLFINAGFLPKMISLRRVLVGWLVCQGIMLPGM